MLLLTSLLALLLSMQSYFIPASNPAIATGRKATFCPPFNHIPFANPFAPRRTPDDRMVRCFFRQVAAPITLSLRCTAPVMMADATQRGREHTVIFKCCRPPALTGAAGSRQGRRSRQASTEQCAPTNAAHLP